MSKTFQNIPGTFDILPEAFTSDGTTVESSASWHYVEERIREVMAHYRFHEIRTPIFEPTELIARGVGELTDIVSKEMFAFERGDTHYVLRPELTAPAIRAYLQHHLAQKGGIQKLYYMGPCFRAEKPQKGRYRQFHQFGVEIIGAIDARADAETVAVLIQIYKSFGLKDLVLKINSLGDEKCRPAYKTALQEYFEPLASKLSETSRKRLKTNPLRILDTKIEDEQELIQGAPRLVDFIDDASREHYEDVKGHLTALEIPFVEDPFLVRGLDYYTRTAYELDSPHLGAQSTLAGGGRYDLLAQELGSSEAIPAVGFAAGIERLFLALDGEGIALPDAEQTDVYIIALGDGAEKWAFKTANEWRVAGLRVAFDLQGRSMKAQMRDANRHGASKVVIVGDDELTSGKAIVRQMETGDQETAPFDGLLALIR